MSEKQLTLSQKAQLEKKQAVKYEIDRTNEAFLKMYGKEGQQVFMREQHFAFGAISKNPEILNCTPVSIYNSVAAVAMTGLSLDPVKQLAHLIPRKGVCTLVVDYKGLLELLSRETDVICSSGAVYDCDLNIDDFKEGVGGYVNAKRAMPRPANRTLLYCYNVAHFPDGRTHCHIMDKEQIDKRRKKAQTEAVWSEWEEGMSIKTVIRDHYKHLPKTNRLDEAMKLVDSELPTFTKTKSDDDDFLDDLPNTPQEGTVTVIQNENQ